jgi:flagellar hook-length control protein FliK
LTAIAATHQTQPSEKQSLVNSTASASNTSSSNPSTFDSIMSALGLSNDSDTSPAIPSTSPKTIANAGTTNPSGHSVLTAKSQKSVTHKPLKSLKLLTPGQAAMLAAQSQNAPAQSTQSALASSLASTPSASSSGWSINSTISSVESAIKGGFTDVVDALGGLSGLSSPSSTPAAPPLVAPIIGGQGNLAASKAQVQSAANTATSANSEALQTALAQATSANSAQDPDAADATMDASALDGARITAAANPTAAQMAASKQQAFANLKPAADVKATETQALPPDAGLSKPDSLDTGAKGGNSGSSSNNANGKSQDNSPSASTATATPGSQPSDPQPQTAQPTVSFSTQVADNMAANTAATANAAPTLQGVTAPATGIAVGPATDQSVAANLDTSSLAVSIAAKSIEGAKQFDIRLDPPELGRVDVKLSVDPTGKAQAHLTVEKPQTLEMLQKDSGSLQRSLKDSGVDLSNNGLQFSLKNQQQSASLPQTPRGRSLALSAAAIAAPVSTNGYAHGNARLDIRV